MSHVHKAILFLTFIFLWKYDNKNIINKTVNALVIQNAGKSVLLVVGASAKERVQFGSETEGYTTVSK